MLSLTPCDTMDRSLPSSSVYGILQARILEWGVIAFSSISNETAKVNRKVSLLLRASLIAQLVKNPPEMQETLVQFLGREDPLKKG